MSMDGNHDESMKDMHNTLCTNVPMCIKPLTFPHPIFLKSTPSKFTDFPPNLPPIKFTNDDNDRVSDTGTRCQSVKEEGIPLILRI